jgi:hypothetical protein
MTKQYCMDVREFRVMPDMDYGHEQERISGDIYEKNLVSNQFTDLEPLLQKSPALTSDPAELFKDVARVTVANSTPNFNWL